MSRLATVSPPNSTAAPSPPAAPYSAIRKSARSLAVAGGAKAPLMTTCKVAGLPSRNVEVASTCSVSLVPMPNARQPKAPSVHVWESGQTTVSPGSAMPCSALTKWPMPWSASSTSNSRSP